MLCIWSLALVAGWEPCNLHDLCSTCFLRWMLYRANPARPITTASEELDDLDHDLNYTDPTQPVTTSSEKLHDVDHDLSEL